MELSRGLSLVEVNSHQRQFADIIESHHENYTDKHGKIDFPYPQTSFIKKYGNRCVCVLLGGSATWTRYRDDGDVGWIMLRRFAVHRSRIEADFFFILEG